MLQGIHGNRQLLCQQRLIGQADIIFTANVQLLRHGVMKSFAHQVRRCEIIRAAGSKFLHAVRGVRLFFLDVLYPAVYFSHVRIVGITQRMWMKSAIGWNCACALILCNKLFEMLPIPITREIAIIYHHR